MRIAGIARMLLIVIISIHTATVKAQLSADDSVFLQKAVAHAVSLYRQSTGDQSGLYNGSQYAGYPFNFKDGGHPYFITDAAVAGSIVYDNTFYPGARLLFNEISDLLVFEDSTHRIQLISERVAAFSIGSNRFMRIVRDSLSSPLTATGFYNVLYEGRVTVLKKEVKSIREELRSVDDGVIRSIDKKLFYYIKKDSVYFPVGTKNTLLRIYKDKKKEIQQYIKANDLSFKKDRDNLLIKTGAYYDQLTK